ncbi:hypothetical protein F66182_4833 [Fusarium sp. NRRL 66182]|nr:hypothetical protein F66182_4833 [Fusarium sp. NRRL 66182]
MTATNRSSHRLRPWQQKALDKGRTPLPEGPGDSQPRSSTMGNSSREPVSSDGGYSPPPECTVGTPTQSPVSADTAASSPDPCSIHFFLQVSNRRHKFWTDEALEKLIRLKRDESLDWASIHRHFPARTLESLKRMYHKKRRETEERMAAKERAAKEKRGQDSGDEDN